MTKLREIKLIAITETLDSLNQPVKTPTEKTVIAEVRSISRSEYFAGRQGGLTPDISFLVSVFDYSGEPIVEYNGKKLPVYRTYEADENYIEIYCQVEGGVTNV